MNSKSFYNHLTKQIVPFWDRLLDKENGGFYGAADSAGVPDKDAVKGTILMSRILWFYSSAYEIIKDRALLYSANHVYHFLTRHCYDDEYGGVFWSVRADGTPFDDTKHTYCQAFSIYALSAFYRVCKNEEALEFAYKIRNMIEEKCRDESGYLEAFERDFTPASNEKLSENGVLAERTMNTLLHVMEGYTELYNADKNSQVGDSLREILHLFKSKVYDSEKKICQVFFDENYNSLIDLESYGHNIEASWLIDKACKALGGDARINMQSVIEGLAEGALSNGIDAENHAMNNEREKNAIDRKKVWWVQAEAVIGFYNFYQHDASRKDCLKISGEIWDFIQNKVIDSASGEWHEWVLGDNSIPEMPLVHEWKGPYHSGRVCIEMIRRLAD